MAESLSSTSTVEDRIQFYSRAYHQLFPVNLDIEKVWEIAILQADSILRDNEECSHTVTLSRIFFDKSASSWTRAIAGASLMQSYCSSHKENAAVNELMLILSPAATVNDSAEETRDASAAVLVERTEYTNNDILMISMYALSLFRRVQDKKLLECFLESCTTTIENYSSQTTSKGFESSDKVCLSVLSTLLSKGSNLHRGLCDALENNSMEFLTRFFALLYSKNLSVSVSREQIAKRLISPLITLVGNGISSVAVGEILIDLTWFHCSRIAGENNGDLATCSIILCVLMSIPTLQTMKRIGRNDLWNVLSLCFLSSDALVRKRAAFVMQLIPNTSRNVKEEIVEASKLKKGKGKKPKADKNRGTDAALVRPEPEPICIAASFSGPPMLFNGLSGARGWWSDFLDVYGQIEGCTSMHLVDQIWPQLEHLCRLAAVPESDIDISGMKIDSGSFSYPVVGFEWVKALLHVLLQISIPGIRKAVLRRILLGGGPNDSGLALNASRRSIYWLCFELLPLIDSVGFFSAYFLAQGVDVGCSDVTGGGGGGDDFLLDAKINVLAHPGILMPSFIARMLRSLLTIDKSTVREVNELPLVHELILSIVHVVCGENGLHSLSAVKWIVRVFAEPCILALIPPCIGPTELREMRAFFRGRLACSNGVVREHVLQGLLPLFLRGTDPLTVSLTDLLQMVTGDTCFGLNRIVNHSASFSSLKAVVINSSIANLGGLGAGCPLNEIDGHLIAVMYAIIADSSTSDEDKGREVDTESTAKVVDVLEKLCTEHLDVISQLYRSPYIEREQQLRAIGFLSGVARTMVLAHNQLPGAAAGQGKSSGTARMRMLFPLLPVMQSCSTDVSSYLSIAVTASLTAAAESPLTRNSECVPLLIDCVSLLDDCSFVLGSLLLLPRLLPDTSTLESPALSVIMKTIDSLSSLLSSSTSLSIETVLTVRCAFSLLSSMQASWPFPGIVPHTQVQIMTSISRLVSLLIKIAEPSSSAFRSFLSTTRLNMEGSEENKARGTALLVDMARTLDFQFGRVSSMFVEYRWAGIRAGLNLLVLANSQDGNISTVMNYHNGSSSGLKLDYALFSLAIDQLDSCSMSSLPDILSACLVVVRRLSTSQGGVGSEEDGGRRAALLLKLLDAAWRTATGGSVYTDVRAITSFVRLAFDVSVLKCLDDTDVRVYYDKVEALGLKNRPHIMQSLVCALCAAWSADITLSAPFFPLMSRLLMYREPRQDDHNVPDNTGREGGHEAGGAPESEGMDIAEAGDAQALAGDAQALAGICRFSVLSFLETCMDSDAAQSQGEQQRGMLTGCLTTLIVELIALNNRDDFVQAAMIGSDLYGQKLRCWQSLCVLTKYVTRNTLSSILEEFFVVLGTSAGHSIRVHIELFGAAMAIRYPSVMMPRLLLALREFNHTQQMLCSIFVILGHAVLNKSEPFIGDVSVVEVKTGILVDLEIAKEVVTHLLPWMACGAGLPRTVAQLLMHSLIPIVLGDTCSTPSASMASPSSSCFASSSCDGRTYLQCIHQYLTLNRDSNKGISKQRKFFSDFNPENHCSVTGLSLIGVDNTGEVVAPHILTFLADTIKADVEIERESARERQREHVLCDTSTAATDTSAAPAIATLQTKRVPFDELQLSLESEVLSRQQNAAGRKRQEVVVCASLIDKVTNLAGIARTCEIFAVQELVLANLGVVQSDVFQGIAVSCDQWLPISEVPVHALTAYLQGMRRMGYTILGLEQTDNSENLGGVSDLPGKCVLLLGREKEGIPVELLQEIDCCLEIPQYGVIRSLNVHVSAALAIWEITKQNKKFLENNNANKLAE